MLTQREQSRFAELRSIPQSGDMQTTQDTITRVETILSNLNEAIAKEGLPKAMWYIYPDIEEGVNIELGHSKYTMGIKVSTNDIELLACKDEKWLEPED